MAVTDLLLSRFRPVEYPHPPTLPAASEANESGAGGLWPCAVGLGSSFADARALPKAPGLNERGKLDVHSQCVAARLAPSRLAREINIVARGAFHQERFGFCPGVGLSAPPIHARRVVARGIVVYHLTVVPPA